MPIDPTLYFSFLAGVWSWRDGGVITTDLATREISQLAHRSPAADLHFFAPEGNREEGVVTTVALLLAEVANCRR